ncbi:MAG: hypothetical protein JW939_01760 [Candidatus Thermoplasmatota archaeon]|nr:hypothetical protein [Candidatus Thermoplasmatota archaeon]
MEHALVTLIGPLDWARSVGKETSSTSFGIGSLKKDDKLVTTLYPSRYPEKIWSLLFSLSLSESVFLNIDRIDRDLGETIIALDLLGKTGGSVHIGPLVDLTMLGSVIKGTVVEGYGRFDQNPATFREELFEIHPPGPSDGCDIVVDQAFNVKGVGCVVLGFVTRGSVSRHQNLTAFPCQKRTVVRSIQIHDRDFDEAPAGARVGLALKNIEPEDLPRGCLLTEDEGSISSTDRLRARFVLSRYWKEELLEGSRFHLWSSLQFTPVQIENIERGRAGELSIECDLNLESGIWNRKGEKMGLVFLDSRGFRMFASGESI